MENSDVRSFSPYAPSPRSSPYRSALTDTSVPGGQYSFGRQCTAVSSSSHAHEPSTSVEVSTDSARSTAALLRTGASKVMEIGIAMPYVWPSPTFIEAPSVRAGATVRNDPSTGVVRPSLFVAVPDHVYVLP